MSLPDEDTMCLTIIHKENYYDILEVNSKSTLEQIKKSYRLIALKIHPDKNKSTFARQAFQKLSKSFVCLSSEKLREIYDKTGNEEIPDSALQQNFDEDFADKIYNDVFKEAMASREKRKEPLYKSYLAKCFILQLFPIVVVLALCMYTNMQYTEKAYSFMISPHYNMKKFTRENHVSYYVNSEFDRSVTEEDLQHIELEVEERYSKYLVQKALHTQKQIQEVLTEDY